MRTALLVALLLISTSVFATETVEKISDTQAKITISNVSDKDGVKTTLSQEKVFTLDELNAAKALSENALKSWQDEATKAQENITLQTTQIALWSKLIAECEKQGIKAKVIEEQATKGE